MVRTRMSGVRRAIWAAAAFVASLAFAPASEAGTVWMTTVSLGNNSGGVVNDLEANFSGTADSIYGANLVRPAGTITPNAAQAMIRIDFDPAINNGTAIQFTFLNTASPDVAFEFGIWTDQNGNKIKDIDIVRDNVSLTTVGVPEPSTLILAGTGGLIGVGYTLRRRRRT
jgi:hypothetical protein